jgi:hypothetical protein
VSNMSEIDAAIREEIEALDDVIYRALNDGEITRRGVTDWMVRRNAIAQWAKDQGMTGYPITQEADN